MRILLDEMYSSKLAAALGDAGVDAVTVADAGFSGRPDADVFALAGTERRAVLTENVADFARIAADHLSSGLHHPGVIVALSSRFSRRPAGHAALVAAIRAVAREPLADRVLYLERA